MPVATQFASTDNYARGGVTIIGDEQASRYLFSNMFDVAAKSAPWERVVIAKNLEYTIECVRAERTSPWYICAHDETALVMQSEVEVHFVKPQQDSLTPASEHPGAVRLNEQPDGPAMGWVKLSRGHMALLPAGAAYQFRAAGVGVILLQSLLGDESIERWADICQH